MALYYIKFPNGRRWKVRQAKSLQHALQEISNARVTGSVGSKTTMNYTLCGGTIETLADVVQVNSDYTERQPYSTYY